jgi:hypothetical protein
MSLYRVTRFFTAGLLKGQTYTEVTAVKMEVGFDCQNPVGNGSPYRVTRCIELPKRGAPRRFKKRNPARIKFFGFPMNKENKTDAEQAFSIVVYDFARLCAKGHTAAVALKIARISAQSICPEGFNSDKFKQMFSRFQQSGSYINTAFYRGGERIRARVLWTPYDSHPLCTVNTF